MKLTKTDKEILDSYSKMLDGLADYMGTGYEIALHSLENYDESIIKIINGHYSNRTVGAPLTSYAFSLLKQIERNDIQHKFLTYFNRDENGTLLKACTIPIVGEKNRIIALLCITFYTSVNIEDYFKNLFPGPRALKHDEVFATDSNSLLKQSVDIAKKEVEANPLIQSVNRNKVIINILYKKGIFNMKDSVEKVAKLLAISKNTVYMHIRNFEAMKNPK